MMEKHGVRPEQEHVKKPISPTESEKLVEKTASTLKDAKPCDKKPCGGCGTIKDCTEEESE